MAETTAWHSHCQFITFITFLFTDNVINNNKRICIAQVCRMTSEALGGQLQSCYTARARPKCLTEEKCFKTTELESYSTKYQCSESSRQQERSNATHIMAEKRPSF